MKKLLFVLGFICCISSIYAQRDYRPGYVITLSNDTIWGQINYQDDNTMGTGCRFQSSDQIKTNYAPGEIKGYRFIDSKYYVSREVNGHNYFLEFLISGKINIYYLRDLEGNHYYIEKEGKPLVKIPYTNDIRQIDGKNFYYQSTLHYGLLNLYSEDVPQLNNEIKKIKEPSHRNLIKFGKDYHNFVCKDEECIIFERPTPLARIQIEPIVGSYHFFSQQLPVAGINHFSYGAWIYLWLPHANEKFSFKTGIFFSEQDNYRWNRIPIQVEYLYPKGIIRPTIAGGTTLFLDKGGIMALIPNYSVGLKIIPKKSKISFSVNYELETMHNTVGTNVLFLIPGSILLGQHLSAGINYSF